MKEQKLKAEDLYQISKCALSALEDYRTQREKHLEIRTLAFSLYKQITFVYDNLEVTGKIGDYLEHEARPITGAQFDLLCLEICGRLSQAGLDAFTCDDRLNLIVKGVEAYLQKLGVPIPNRDWYIFNSLREDLAAREVNFTDGTMKEGRTFEKVRCCSKCDKIMYFGAGLGDPENEPGLYDDPNHHNCR